MLGTVNGAGYDDRQLQQLLHSRLVNRLQHHILCGTCACSGCRWVEHTAHMHMHTCTCTSTRPQRTGLAWWCVAVVGTRVKVCQLRCCHACVRAKVGALFWQCTAHISCAARAPMLALPAPRAVPRLNCVLLVTAAPASVRRHSAALHSCLTSRIMTTTRWWCTWAPLSPLQVPRTSRTRTANTWLQRALGPLATRPPPPRLLLLRTSTTQYTRCAARILQMQGPSWWVQ